MKINKVDVYDGKKVIYRQEKRSDKTTKLIANIKVDGKIVEIAPNLVKQMDYYEFEDDEKFGLNMFKNSTKQAEELYESALRKQKRYERLLLDKINKNAVFGNESCELSPFNKCCYVNDTCVFCGKNNTKEE